MAKVFYLRHQAAGILTQFPFVETPSETQIAAIKALCDDAHGELHAKTDEPYWLKVVEATMFGPTDMPEPPDPRPPSERVSGAGGAGVGQISAQGFGRVENREV